MSGSRWSRSSMDIKGLGEEAQTLLTVVRGRDVALHQGLELLAGVEGDHVAGLDGDGLACARVAPGPRCLAPDVEVAEARELDVLAGDELVTDDFEEGLDHVLGLA